MPGAGYDVINTCAKLFSHTVRKNLDIYILYIMKKNLYINSIYNENLKKLLKG